MSDNVKNYLASIKRKLSNGDATEHTHRASLQTLIDNSGLGLEATNEPKTPERENKPDYVVRKNQIVIGYVEAKDVDKSMREVLKSAQIKRYLEALPNLLVTNYLEFVWFCSGEERMRVTLGSLSGKNLNAEPQASANWQNLIASFANEVSPVLSSPHQLAKALAGQTRLLRDLVAELTDSGDADLQSQHEAFKTLLVPDLGTREFADMYAQTATYGLFTARVFDHATFFGSTKKKLPKNIHNQAFTLEKATYLIPKASPFLRDFFQHIANPNLSEQLRWLVEQIADSLHYTDIQKVLVKQSRKQGFEDPVFHFYETFLAEYDRSLREQRGVYYTPEPVVDYIVRSVDALLRKHFHRGEGLADPSTLILDPATGTATFLRRVVQLIHQRVTENGNNGLWPSYVNEHLLPRLFGFELMMAPYTVAHLKLALQLQESGAQLDKGERLNVYLTNTLDRLQKQTHALLGQWIAKENEGAEKVKDTEPIQVILGNPPYSGESKNKGVFIMNLIDEYKKEPNGSKLREKNSKWINDDYVKFIRFAHDRISRTGHGIVAFITNHGWLDNPTFRGMRASLMRSFDDIYLLDLHGNSKKKERTPDTLRGLGQDKNVFDIEQGVAITFLVKKAVKQDFSLAMQDSVGTSIEGTGLPNTARIHHAELWGDREHKYSWLHSNSVGSTLFTTLEPALPLLLFVPRNEARAANYETWWSVAEVLPVNSVGIVTARDGLTIHFRQNELEQTIKVFNSLSPEEARQRFGLGKDSRDWRVEWAQQDLKQVGATPLFIKDICYRPFDARKTFYTGKTKGFICMPRSEVMKTLQEGALFFATCRQVKSGEWSHVLVGTGLVESCYISNGTSEIATVMPLWALSDNKPILNINPKFLQALAQSLGVDVDHEQHGLPLGVAPEDVVAYLYAVLFAPSYRMRFGEMLKSDFPRVPITTSDGTSFKAVWEAMVGLGGELMQLHLLSGVPKKLMARFPVQGSNELVRVQFEITPNTDSGRVWINDRQYFDHVSSSTWAYRIGSYQVCEKWLKDRKGRTLNHEDIEHYQTMVGSLARTQQLQQEIDCVAPPLWKTE